MKIYWGLCFLASLTVGVFIGVYYAQTHSTQINSEVSIAQPSKPSLMVAEPSQIEEKIPAEPEPEIATAPDKQPNKVAKIYKTVEQKIKSSPVVQAVIQHKQEPTPTAQTEATPSIIEPELAELEELSSGFKQDEEIRLNLKLPDLDWEKYELNEQKNFSYPSFFYKKEDISRLKLSGKLLWDESEEANTKPIEDTILGAELEFKVLLP
ncbi:MAG: hypothetical protein WAO12_04910 [Venatoribacter sp.]